MKIAFFTDSYYPMLNGVTVSVANLAAELRALGHTVYIFAPKYDNYVDKEKNVYRFNAVKVISSEPEVHMPVFMPHKILSDISPRDFDIVHAHGNGFFSLLGYQVARMKGVPYLMTFHTQLTRYLHYVFNGKLVTPRMAAAGLRISGNICDTVITPSEKMKRELESFGVNKPIEVVPNFVYSERFTSNYKGFLHKLCQIPDGAPILLSVGRLGREKNFPFLLRAYKKVAEDHPGCHLVIVGYGEEADSLKEYARKLKLDGRIHFTGKIQPQDIAKVYADSDIFVFSSLTEVHPMVILEAASAGLPFVVVNDPAYANAVIDGENGFVVPLRTGAFAEKILTLLADSKLRKKFGQRSREIVAENFHPQKLASDMAQIYESLLLTRKQRRLSFASLNKATWRRVYRATEILDKIFE